MKRAAHIKLFLTLALVLPLVASAAEKKFPEALVKDLPQISGERFAQLKELDPAIFREGEQAADVRQLDIKTARRIFDFMVVEKWRSLDLFANPYFLSDHAIIYLPREVLTLITKEYDIQTLFSQRGFTRKERGVVPAGTYFELDGALIGKGRNVYLYPFHVAVHRTDGVFGFLNGNYEFYRVNILSIGKGPENEFSLNDFMGRDDPKEELRHIKGPMNVSIHRMEESQGGERVKVNVGIAWWTFPHLNVSRFEPPLYQRPSKETGIPDGVLQESLSLVKK